MPAAYKRCVEHVRGKAKNPHAVCTASNAGNVKQFRKRERRKRPSSKSLMGRVARGK